MEQEAFIFRLLEWAAHGKINKDPDLLCMMALVTLCQDILIPPGPRKARLTLHPHWDRATPNRQRTCHTVSGALLTSCSSLDPEKICLNQIILEGLAHQRNPEVYSFIKEKQTNKHQDFTNRRFGRLGLFEDALSLKYICTRKKMEKCRYWMSFPFNRLEVVWSSDADPSSLVHLLPPGQCPGHSRGPTDAC